MFLPHPRVKVNIAGSLRDREVACSASDRQGSNFESCVWRTVSSQSSHHPQEVLLAQFSLYVHKGGLKPDSFHLIPERVNKVISGERIGTYIPLRFLRRLQKTAGFGTKAVVGKAVIRQAFIRQMPASIRAHLATQPDSATLESLAVLADRALAAEEDVEESKPGVAEIKVEETTKLVGLLEDLSRRIKKLETVTTSERKRNKGRGRVNNNYTPAPTFAPNVQASGFVNNQPSHYRNEQNNARPFVPPTNVQQNARLFVPPPNPQRNDAAKTMDTTNAPVCYFHQTFGDKARECSSPCAFSLNC